MDKDTLPRFSDVASGFGRFYCNFEYLNIYKYKKKQWSLYCTVVETSTCHLISGVYDLGTQLLADCAFDPTTHLSHTIFHFWMTLLLFNNSEWKVVFREAPQTKDKNKYCLQFLHCWKVLIFTHKNVKLSRQWKGCLLDHLKPEK